jgi:predicted acyl esterase
MHIGKTLGAASLAALLMTSAVHAQKAPKPGAYNETPAKLVESTEGFDFERRDVMIPMRDGVKLHTVILVPKGAKRAPILLTRTPYNATELTSHAASGTLAAVLQGYDNAADVIVEGGYIRVVQDVRGKYGSEGDYVMNRPLQGPLNPTKVDHATDTYDTIDWLVKNIAETNGKVGILGISYDGFLPLMALVNPHPALKVSVPMNPMVDGWMGDDWFHHGAFRQQNLPYIWEQQAMRDNSAKWWSNTKDDYDLYLRAGSAGELARQRGLEQVGFWKKIVEHPAYDAFWQEQAMDKVLAKQPLKVPVMLVHGLWDQEDIYGATAVYKALKPLDTAGDKVFLAMGPWFHGQQIEDGSALGAIKWDADTAKQFRHEVLAPFLARYLKDDAPAADIAPVNAFETGTNTCRTDVLTFTTDVLTAPVQISGEPLVNLIASTSGTDSDWVVKLIDVYPDMVPAQPEMGGYQLAVSMDIFRGRYRESYSDPKAITPDKPLPYRFGLPTTNHVFKPGHRIMVQVQSSWFPLYDRNPQTFVPNIFFAKPAEYVKATQRVFHSGDAASFISLPVVEK